MTREDWYEIEDDMVEVKHLESESRRWVTNHTYIYFYKPDDSLWFVSYETPNTECQEGSEDENYYLKEAEAYQETVTAYRSKESK